MVFENFPTWALIIFSIILLLFFSISATITYIIFSRMKWNMTATILQDTPPYGVIPVRRDKCRLVQFGDGGEEIYFLKRMKKHKVAYGKKIGAKNICWVIGGDGYWYNSSFGSLDKKLLEIGVVPVDRDMRLANSVLRKGIENRYNDKSFIEKWGVPITIGMLVVAILAQAGGTYFNIRESNKAKATELETAKVNLETQKLSQQTLNAIANLQQAEQGSGLVSATPIATTP